MAKKQTKADKAFIEKIGTIGISTGSKKEPKTCPDCGHELKPIGMLVGEMHGKPIGGPVYGRRPERMECPSETADEQSFSA